MKRRNFRRPPVLVRFSIVSMLIVHLPMTQSGGVHTMNDCQRGPESSTDFDFSTPSLPDLSTFSTSFVSFSLWGSVSGCSVGVFVSPSRGSMSMMTSFSVIDLSVHQSLVSTSRHTLQLANFRPCVTSNENRFPLLTFEPSPAVRSRHKSRDNHLTTFINSILQHCVTTNGNSFFFNNYFYT